VTTDYGSDISGIDDVDSELSFVDGLRAFAEALCRRLGSVPGTLEDDPTHGYDLTLLVGDVIDPSEEESKIVEQMFYDDRTAAATAQVTQLQSSLEVKIFVEASGGETFTMTLAVTALRVEMIDLQIPDAA
jgi:hypothetical protein